MQSVQDAITFAEQAGLTGTARRLAIGKPADLAYCADVMRSVLALTNKDTRPERYAQYKSLSRTIQRLIKNVGN
jgi:hypothetical protein